mgnify:CR=1 FL=1|tara:strand:- start:3438 stop:3731 length:294 start_codon:yes stop_codon:yes gene_type:complete
MSNQEQKIYCGSGVEKFDGGLIEISVCLSDIPQEHRFDYKGKWYAKLKVQKKRETDEYGKSHYVCVNTFKPDNKEEVKVEQPVAKKEEEKVNPDLPF